jgi:hypothetical protein
MMHPSNTCLMWRTGKIFLAVRIRIIVNELTALQLNTWATFECEFVHYGFSFLKLHDAL